MYFLIYFILLFMPWISGADTCFEILSVPRDFSKKISRHEILKQVLHEPHIRYLFIENLWPPKVSTRQRTPRGLQTQSSKSRFKPLLKEDVYTPLILKYATKQGELRFAIERFNGNVEKAYNYMETKLSHDPMWNTKIGWHPFYGHVEDFFLLIKELFIPLGPGNNIYDYFYKESRTLEEMKEHIYFWQHLNLHLKEEYKGLKGFGHLALALYKGNLSKTYVNGDAVLGNNAFGGKWVKLIGWEDVHGIIYDKSTVEKWVKNHRGAIRMEYRSWSGLDRLARTHYQGDKKRAYINLLTVLPVAEFQTLLWPELFGTPYGSFNGMSHTNNPY